MTKYVYTYLLLEIGEMGEMDEIVEMVEIGCHFALFARATSLSHEGKLNLAWHSSAPACFVFYGYPLNMSFNTVFALY